MTVQKIVSYANPSIVNNSSFEKKLFYAFSGIFAVSFLLYGVFLADTVFNIVSRKNTETEARALTSHIGQMELEYLSLSGKVDMQMAQSLGFSEVSKTNAHFASRKPFAKSVALANNEL